MHVFIPVYFNAPHGGLHEHVRAQTSALARAGHKCTVQCKPGPFAYSIRDAGTNVAEASFESLDEAFAIAESAGPYDLVHAHPGLSRIVGLKIAERQGIPFFLTLHGRYLDDLPTYADRVDRVLVVSEAARDFLVATTGIPPYRIVRHPNAVDTGVFYPDPLQLPTLTAGFPALGRCEVGETDRIICLASRLDADTSFIVDVVEETWQLMRSTPSLGIVWFVAGNGTLLPRLQAEAARLDEAAGRQVVWFLGWQDSRALRSLYSRSHLVVAPGRCALEAMACGAAVVAIGGRFIGLLDEESLVRGIYCNFGGIGGHREYQRGALLRDINRVIGDNDLLAELGRFGRQTVSEHFCQATHDRALLRMYESAVRVGRRVGAELERQENPIATVAFREPDSPALSAQWSLAPADVGNCFQIVSEQRSSLLIACDFVEGAAPHRVYLKTGQGGLDEPPDDATEWAIGPERPLRIRSVVTDLAGNPSLQLWFIEYSADRRLKHMNAVLRPGTNEIVVRTSADTRFFRIAYRFGGRGSARVFPPELWARTIVSMSLQTTSGDGWDDVRRQFRLSDEYLHMNALFIASHPTPVRDAIEAYRRELDADPVQTLQRESGTRRHQVLKAAAQYLGVNVDEIALTDSTTMGLAVVYNGIRLREDQELLASKDDYYVTHEVLRQTAARSGATVRHFSLYDRIEEVTEEGLLDTIRHAVRPETRILALTWVHSSTGLKLPLRRIADAVGKLNEGRDHDDRVLLCVDGVHGFGVENIVLPDLAVDFFIAGCHKWLFGPRGTGLVWGNGAAWAATRPTIPSFIDHGTWTAWLNGEEPEGPTTASQMTPGGFKAFEHLWALRAAFEFHQQIGKERVERRTHELARQLKEGLARMRHIKLVTPMDDALSSGLVCFDVEGMSPSDAVMHLRDRRIIATVTPYAVQHVLLAPSIRNSSQEIDKALAEIRTLA